MNQIYIRGNEIITADQIQEYIKAFLSGLDGYDANVVQVLKNINGVLIWVTEE